jgi:hypothetical protein
MVRDEIGLTPYHKTSTCFSTQHEITLMKVPGLIIENELQLHRCAASEIKKISAEKRNC